MPSDTGFVPKGLAGPGAATLLETDMFRPVYRPMQGERWRLDVVPMCMAPGYWSGPRLVTDMAALLRVEDEGRSVRTWMSMTPMEIESQELGCRAAAGHTVVMGLGMGWAAANAALQPEVTAVTVVEFDPEVISMIGEIGVFGQLPEDARSKITIVRGDALAYVPDTSADTLLADIWLSINGPGRAGQVQSMRANTRAARVYFWGQEMVIAGRARALGLPLEPDDAGRASVERIIAELGLPLIGPELPDYPERVVLAAAQWLREA
ncbi:hypothetical protein SAE02_13740 [Skermanella aerolata]|uniref:Spermidine synthase n=1 Tax=Skermanella aerolata TaxID=393310 RepID=A0A512DL80_9PROT|nr:hypothetical protein [Skermanella aerolata]KJB92885.1 hypothetical protein N826_20880 [Skermanella aerolata KACC 11604]GEO37226.1 hypothetical protein SAE02_13740 [Skermanella aerolata]